MRKLLSLIMFSLPFWGTAQIHYTDIIPDTTIVAVGGIYRVDLDNNGIPDYSIQKYFCLDTIDYHIIIRSANPVFIISYFLLEGSCHMTERYNLNDTIPSSWSLFDTAVSTLAMKCLTTCIHDGDFIGSTDAFIGLKMYRNDTVFYGWIRVDVDSNARWITIKDYAYCANGILAGQTFNSIHDQENQELIIKENEDEIVVTPARGLLLHACLYDLLSRESVINIEDRSVTIPKKYYKPGVYVLFLKTSLGNSSVKLVIRP